MHMYVCRRRAIDVSEYTRLLKKSENSSCVYVSTDGATSEVLLFY